MRTRHVATSATVGLTVAVLVALLVALTACSDGDSKSTRGARTSSSSPSGAGLPDSCTVLTTADVRQAVGTPVKQAQHTVSGQVVTGGSSDRCLWVGTEKGHVADQATLILYSDSAACDSVRTTDSPPVDGLGASAFQGVFASVYVYRAKRCFMAQWYSFEGTDDQNVAVSTALAKAAAAQL